MDVDLLVAPGPEDGEEVDGCDGRSEVGGDGLDVDVELAALLHLDDGDPGDGQRHHHQHPQPTHRQLLPRRRVRPALAVPR